MSDTWGEEVTDSSQAYEYAEQGEYAAAPQEAQEYQAPAQEDVPREASASAPEPQPAQTGVEGSAYGAVGGYKVGNPYLIDGVSYYPHEDYNYSEIGIASWYGPDFHGGKTSNGETFDENKFVAAHRTLPRPSLVRVTNLETGICATIKIHDRGPYARDRILDLSSAAADALGIKTKGSARVKVDLLAEESRNLKTIAMANGDTDIYPPNVGQCQAQSIPERTSSAIAEASSVPSSSEGGDYYVQVAAYSTYDRAESLKNRIMHIGTVKIFKAVVDGNTLYKVRLGEYATKEDADRVQRAVTDSGVPDSRVIKKEGGGFRWKF
jgi:rare lipoprotein A